MFGRKKRSSAVAAQTVPDSRAGAPFAALTRYTPQSFAERELYSALREAVPIIDAAIGKIVRLTGSFRIVSGDRGCEKAANEFIGNVRVNGTQQGLSAFIGQYLDSLLTYGEAVGEMIPFADGSGIGALYNASLEDIEIRPKGSPLELEICRREPSGSVPVRYPGLVLATLFNQRPGTVKGTSLLSGLPFVSSILLRVLNSVKTNWERVGDVRFAVTCNPGNGQLTEEGARQIADEWRKAMRSESVCDFISAGDISVKVIGAESSMPDCEVPVRTVLEQITAKLGIPPFLLGLSWSSTERMSTQQVDILTSELEYYRAALEPVIRRVVKTHLRLNGWNSDFSVEWSEINLQDAVELSSARLNNAQALKLERETEREEGNDTKQA